MNMTEKRCWADISLDAIKNNFDFIKHSFGRPFYTVIKADGYGHGAKYLAGLYEQLGAYGIAVSCFAEAMEIRKSGVKLPILILGHTDPSCATQLSRNQLSQCVYSPEYAQELQNASLYPIDCHLKLDTGMGRIGFDLVNDRDKAYEDMKKLLTLTNLRFTGVFAHFPVADSLGEREIAYTERQIELFDNAVNYLTRYGFNFKTIHGQNSAGILRKLGKNFNTMRAGIILYGLNPSKELAGNVLQPAMTVKTIVTHTKTIKEGQCVGYGLCFEAQKETKIATVAIGYADGLPRLLKNERYTMNIGGVDYPVVAICMDQCMLDVTAGDVKPGDEVVAMGGTGRQSFDRIAELIGTINYEIPCGVTKRVPKVYTENGKIIAVEEGI